MRNTADMTGGNPIVVLLQSISDVSVINPLVAFYDIHGGKREVLFFYFVPDTTRDCYIKVPTKMKKIIELSEITLSKAYSGSFELNKNKKRDLKDNNLIGHYHANYYRNMIDM
jgi:hypothetical protein